MSRWHRILLCGALAVSLLGVAHAEEDDAKNDEQTDASNKKKDEKKSEGKTEEKKDEEDQEGTPPVATVACINPQGEVAIKSCAACKQFFSMDIDKCMGCGTYCLGSCPGGSLKEGNYHFKNPKMNYWEGDPNACFKTAVYQDCHSRCLKEPTAPVIPTTTLDYARYKNGRPGAPDERLSSQSDSQSKGVKKVQSFPSTVAGMGMLGFGVVCVAGLALGIHALRRSPCIEPSSTSYVGIRCAYPNSKERGTRTMELDMSTELSNLGGTGYCEELE